MMLGQTTDKESGRIRWCVVTSIIIFLIAWWWFIAGAHHGDLDHHFYDNEARWGWV